MKLKEFLWVFFLFFAFFVIPLQYTSAAQGEALPQDRFNALVNEMSDRGKLRLIVSLEPTSEDALQRPTQKNITKNKLIKQRKTAISSIQSRVSARIGHGVLKRFNNQPSLVVEADSALLQIIQNDPEVIDIQVDRILKTNLIQSITTIGANNTRNANFDGKGLDIAILDTGVDSEHEFLTGRVIAQACFSTTSASYNSSSLCPNGDEVQLGAGAGISCSGISECDHGTHVAGIAAGQGGSFSGVAPQAGIISIQIFSRFNDSSLCGSSNCIASYTSDMILALEYLYDNSASFNIASINLSLGGEAYSSAASCDAANSTTKAAIDDLRSLGIATVISSGNESLSNAIGAPGCISSAISVGATSASDNIASFSNSASWLKLLAPGTTINSSIPGASYANKSGTSMATPHVSGAIAVLKQVEPTSSVDLLVTTLSSTGLAITDLRNGIVKPRIQLDAAAKALRATLNTDGLIIDNLDNNTLQTGSWKTSSGANPWDDQSVYSNSNSTFRWIPSFYSSQAYAVYAWWTYYDNRSSYVPYYISHDAGIDSIEVNQNDVSLAGQWNFLGTYRFTAGGDHYVEISSENGQASADAVRLVPIKSDFNIPPSIQILTPANNSVFLAGEYIVFSAIASDSEDGELRPFVHWHSSIDSEIGNGTSLVISTLSIGNHSITASVVDSEGINAQKVITLRITAIEDIDIIVDSLDDNTRQTGR